MNCVRVPFTYDLLDEPEGFAPLDRAIERAAAKGLYTILDLHGTPGRQSGEHHTGEAGVDRLFKDFAHVQETAAVWARIAARYRDRPEVAAYDLMNEPMGTPDPASLYLVQDRVYRAVRAVDPNHLVVIEDGYKGLETFPRPKLAGWTNVVLSGHHYRFDAKSADDQVKGGLGFAEAAEKVSKSREAPFLAGEFQQEPHGSPQTLGKLIAEMDRRGLSWTVWTYKTAMKDGGGGMWGWVRADRPLDPIDPFRDSADAMIEKAGRLRGLTEDREMTESFRASGPGAAPPR